MTPRRFCQTNSLRSFIIYARLAAEVEQRDTEVDKTSQRVEDADANLNDLTQRRARWRSRCRSGFLGVIPGTSRKSE